jgi:amino acid transporter
MANNVSSSGKKFGTAPVFFTAISTILGAILFLRFGYAVGSLGFFGVLLIIIIGHLVTIPTALAISELATNQRVEGGGEYFIISRSFGLNIGATIGISLFFSQAISVAFYVIAFTEAFEPLFNYLNNKYDITFHRQYISVPFMLLLSWLILSKGANLGVKTLYVVVVVLFFSLALFFMGKTTYMETSQFNFFANGIDSGEEFFMIFAICFPAFTGMTAGVGLSGDLKNPGKSIPLGTTLATFAGMIIYGFIAWKLAVSASPEDLTSNQLIMSQIAVAGPLVIPLGLAASTISSAIGSIMVAPRTLQALGLDRTLPSRKLNILVAKGKGTAREPFNATLLTCIIALVFVIMGDVNAVAEIISMFFMVTYGSLCLISFLYHFGADPSYRPSFQSRWYISMIGFILSIWLMFKINTPYAVMAIILMVLIYIGLSNAHKDRRGLEEIFTGAIFQLSRNLQIFLQKSKKISSKKKWRPSAICISQDSFERNTAFMLLKWISYKYGFGTYIHLLEGYYSKTNVSKANEVLAKLINREESTGSRVYIDTMISPSYTSAIAQVIQIPGISGMENNMIIFEYSKEEPRNMKQIIDNYALTRAGDYDVCILGSSRKQIVYKNGIHVWIRSTDFENSNLMILLSYIILGHPDWKKGHIKIFDFTTSEDLEAERKKLLELIQTGRIPISPMHIEMLKVDEAVSPKTLINQKSADAGLTVVGFRGEQLKHDGPELFQGYGDVGNILFVNSYKQKELQ